MSPIVKIHFPASTDLLKASKKLREQGMKYAKSQQEKHQNKFNNVFLVLKSLTLGIP